MVNAVDACPSPSETPWTPENAALQTEVQDAAQAAVRAVLAREAEAARAELAEADRERVEAIQRLRARP